MNKNADKRISVADAASLLKVSRWRVNQYINEQTLPAERIGRSWTVSESDVLKLQAERKPDGRANNSRPKKAITTGILKRKSL